jgi:predicted RNase H-like HicB family nuclease
MRNIIQFTIEKGEDDYYTASAVGYFIVTQGKTFDELLKNIQEATALHFEDLQDEEKPINQNASIFINYELPTPLHA